MQDQQAPGIPVAVHGHPNLDTLLLWHPAVRTDADAVGALASRIATRGGVRVVVPTWEDGRDLLRSIRYARGSAVHPPDHLTVVGYGEAGIAALSLAQHQRRLGIGLRRVTCVDGGPDFTDPISGRPLGVPAARPDAVATEVDVVASADPAWAEATATSWQAAGWAATLVPADQFTWRVSPSQ
ncbi:hypothetical protein [Nocardioides nitrophenolicus]|uniref:hypothetical protein n=1 Tax=Nocardioides nitrophenolicus TaxID=60489 RepID=UPI001958691A|nr:hypothetical protein [Nocardioides nitrophenolicus]MBM7519845.1 hypothetical protein [Nocardioides nitrophenolicus]